MPTPPRPMARPGCFALGQDERRAGLGQPRHEAARADVVEHGESRQVERQLQCPAHRHGALESEIEILRLVTAVARRPVVDQRLGMNKSVLEAQSVDERLERRAGRAQRLRQIHLAGAPLIEIIRRPDMRAHFAGRVVDEEHRERDIGAERRRQCADAPACKLLQVFLHVGIDRQPHFAAGRHLGNRVICGMRREHRHGTTAGRHRFGLGQRDLVGRHAAGCGKAVEHAIARGARTRRRAIRPSRFRRLRQRHQQRRFAERKPPRLLAEIGQRCRADAFDIAAVGREIEIERKNVVLAQRLLDFDRAHDLAKLGGKIAIAARLQEPRHLHGQRRAAGLNVPAGDELHRGPRERKRVDAVMGRKALVLIGKQHREEARIDIGDARRQAPAALAYRVSAQQSAVTINDTGREGDVFAQRRWAKGRDPPAAGA